MVEIENPYTLAPIVHKTGKFITTKADKRNHGYGLSSVAERLSENAGHIHTEYKDGVFHFMLVLHSVSKNAKKRRTEQTKEKELSMFP